MADTLPKKRALRPNSIGLAAIVFLIIATVAPMSGTIGALPLAFGLGTGSGTAAAFGIVAVVLILFTVGYMAMSRHISSAGGFYVYIGKGLGMRMGRAAGYVAFFSYNVFQVAIWGTFGFFCNIFTAEYFGFELPWIVWVLLGIVAMGILGYSEIDVSAKVLGVAVVLEIGMILAMNFAIVIQGGAKGLSAEPFSIGELLVGNPAIGLMFALMLFIGFEATAIYAEEAREPRKTIPRAAIIAVLVIAGFYMFTSWSLSMAWGVQEAAGIAMDDPGNFIFGAAATYLGEWSVAVMLVLFIISTFATNLGFHNAIARYQFSLARDGWAPRVLERVHPKSQSPFIASMVQTVIAAVVVLIFFFAGAHPYEQMFTWLIALGGLGLIALMAITSVAVVVYFVRSRRETNPWIVVVAPVLAALALGAEVVLLIANWGLQTMDAGGLVPYLPVLLLVAAIVGLAWKRGPEPAWMVDAPIAMGITPERTRASEEVG
ncbi:APC family permease [Homoserinimonas sp. A447]